MCFLVIEIVFCIYLVAFWKLGSQLVFFFWAQYKIRLHELMGKIEYFWPNGVISVLFLNFLPTTCHFLFCIVFEQNFFKKSLSSETIDCIEKLKGYKQKCINYVVNWSDLNIFFHFFPCQFELSLQLKFYQHQKQQNNVRHQVSSSKTMHQGICTRYIIMNFAKDFTRYFSFFSLFFFFTSKWLNWKSN